MFMFTEKELSLWASCLSIFFLPLFLLIAVLFFATVTPIGLLYAILRPDKVKWKAADTFSEISGW